ncbi:MAG TPA: DUF190 domain-containing protein [Mycobacteriales bacterium]|nr:DUF190 domain-containing protein [Mycobacteriales bacterium]
MTGRGTEHLRVQRRLRRLTAYVAEPPQRHEQSAIVRALEQAAELRMAGGTILAGFEGFGHGRHLHHTGLLHAADETPMSLVIIDTEERIDAFIPVLRELLPHAVVIVDDVDTIRYIRPHEHPDRAAPPS